MRLALISDIHEDYLNLKKAVAAIQKAGYDQLICLGDISGFSVPYYNFEESRDAHACLSLLREKSAIILPGNHDFHAMRRIPRESAVFDFPSDWYDLSYEQRARLANNEIWLHEENDLLPGYTEEDMEYLKTLPEYFILKAEGHAILLSHYVFPNLSGYKKGFYSMAFEFTSHFAFMEKQQCDVSIFGHTHGRGLSAISSRRFREYRFRNLRLRKFPLAIGIPPVTNNHKSNGFCIFDTVKLQVQAKRF